MVRQRVRGKFSTVYTVKKPPKVPRPRGGRALAAQEILDFFRDAAPDVLERIPVPSGTKNLTLTQISTWLVRTNTVTGLKSGGSVGKLLCELRESHPGIVPELPPRSTQGGSRKKPEEAE